MKLTHKLCGAALITAIGMAVVVPQGVNATAVSKDLSGGAEIEFTSTSTTTGTQTLPTSGSAEDSGYLPTGSGSGYTTTDPKGFGISFITGLDFGKHSTTTDGTGTWWAQNWKENETKVESAHFINFEDLRTTDNHGYTISAILDQQFTGTVGTTDVELKGAYLDYSNMSVLVRNGYNDAQNPTAGLSTGNAAQVLTTGSTTFLDNTKPATHPSGTAYETGYGQWALMFGKYTNDATDATGSLQSVKMTVPSTNTVIHNTKYSAVVKWTMAEVL